MHRFIPLLLLLVQYLTVFSTNHQVAQRLMVLDQTIERKALYAQKREYRIDNLLHQLTEETDLNQRFQLYGDIFYQYRYYNMLSALAFAEKQLDIANQSQNRSFFNTAMLNKAEIYGIMGMLMEAFSILSKIDRNELDPDQLLVFFSRHVAFYHLLTQNTLAPQKRIQYQQNTVHFRDSILMFASEGSISYNFARTEMLINNGQYEAALLFFEPFSREHDGNFGTLAHILSRIYAGKKNIEKQMEYLANSAIADLREGVKEHIALRELAVLLYHQGDIRRAHRYAKSAIEDAIFSGAQFRILEMSEMLPIIIDAYEQLIRQENRRLTLFSIILSTLFVFLVISVLITLRQMKKLATAKSVLKQTYDDLLQTNKHLDKLNATLVEANHVKEAYIGHFLDLCSDYILKLEKFKSKLNKKAMDKQWDELKQLLKSNEVIEGEREALFQNFDRIFLHLYPDFIDGFNALVVEQERFIPQKGELLNTELRIFALIRLGISDSSKIAQFLDYSPNTIYNYRTRAKNKAIGQREKFEAQIMKIGAILS